MTDRPADPFDPGRLFEQVPSLFVVSTPDGRVVAVTDRCLGALGLLRADVLGRALSVVLGEASAVVGEIAGSVGLVFERVIASRRPAETAHRHVRWRADGRREVRHWTVVLTPLLGAVGEVRHVLYELVDSTPEALLHESGASEAEVSRILRTHCARLEAEAEATHTELVAAREELSRVRLELERRVEERTAALRTTEEQLRVAQRMESLGHLAGGVAHDFNNMLSVILSFTELVAADLGPNDLHQDDLQQVSLAARRASRLTGQLLAFSRQQVLRPRVLEVDRVVRDVERMLGRLLGDDVTLTTRLAGADAPVVADPSQIEQVLANLVVNARDAMPRGGQVTIETRLVHLDESYTGGHLHTEPGPHLMLAVSDNGLGMTKAVQERIFEPFFTTKEAGKGTGLGLSTVYGIVKQSGGTIWVYSEVGVGTTFKVYLPVASQAAEVVTLRPLPAPRNGTETLLLVEDEELVRAAATSILRARGYVVLVASSPAEAERLSGRHPGPIDLLLTDVVMSGRSGRELADALTASRPELRVLFMSGYTDDAVVRHGVLSSDIAFLQKPFSADTLSRRVRDLLDEH